MIKMFLVFILACLVHEYGHFFMAKLYGHKPKIVFKWYGMLTEFYMGGMKFSDKINNHMVGIAVGLVPIVIYNNDLLTFAYLVACLNDFLGVIGCFIYLKKFGDLRLIDTYSLITV